LQAAASPGSLLGCRRNNRGGGSLASSNVQAAEIPPGALPRSTPAGATYSPWRMLRTLPGRLALLQVLAYAALLPLLFVGLAGAHRANAISTFTQHTHAYADSLARELELGDVLDSPSRTVVFLDGAIQGGGCLYAALEYNGQLIGSALTETPSWVQSRAADADFMRPADGIHAVATRFSRGDAAGLLYLGFDKRPTLRQIAAARNLILEALLGYGIVSLAVAVLLARFVTKPLTQLQAASRRVASGETAVRLATSSSVIEIAELARDLEIMRTELVGTADQLRSEMHQRQIEHRERAALESQLLHEQRLATIGTFAGGLAHEFNNILVPLLLYTEESLEEVGQHSVRASLERILAAAKRASSLVSRVLAFSRPATPRQLQPIELAAVTREALELSQALIPSNIELRPTIGALGRYVLGDATLLTQVVLNLCSNAVHAMQANGGVLTVALAEASEPPASGAPRLLELRFADTGHGMAPEVRERIFEPFFTTREVGDGAGLGLSVVHGIITSLGGTIAVSSAPGRGTEFIIRLVAVTPDGQLS
jgi:signal transduction histidine kinase